MERFPARAFYQIGRLLATLRCSCAHAKPKGDPMFAKVLEQQIDDPRGLAELAMQISERCRSIGLTYSLAAAQRLITRVGKGRLTNREAITEIDNLDQRIMDEMANHLFFFMPPKNVLYYLQDPDSILMPGVASPPPLRVQKENLFGAGVQDSFPSSIFDFEEAAKCLAYGQGTACVMHLARVAEVGLKALASELKLPPQNNWGQHLKNIETELMSRYKKTGARTSNELFYAEVAAQLGHIKTAWRNPTMHAESKHTETQGEEIFRAVRSFMQHLATLLHE